MQIAGFPMRQLNYCDFVPKSAESHFLHFLSHGVLSMKYFYFPSQLSCNHTNGQSGHGMQNLVAEPRGRVSYSG